MATDEKSLREFGASVQKLIEKRSLSRKESHDRFRQVLENSQPDLQQGAFLAALTAKGETAEEIAGAWEAIFEGDTRKLDEDLEPPLVENSGTGMDALKTFNVSTAAAIVAAAGGVRLARHGSRALTSSCGTVDILDELGIDVECSVEAVGRSIRETGIGIFNGMSPRVHPKALFRILSRIRFGSTLNIAASLASPCRPTHALRGVYTENVIPKVAEVMRRIGYQRAMVVHGYDGDRRQGMDEISNLGKTVVQEFFPNGSEKTYEFAPEDMGVGRARYEDIAAVGDVRREARRFIQVISGSEHPACVDLTCLNAGAILYVAGKSSDLAGGVTTGRDLIRNGRALKKLCHWISVQSDPEKKGMGRFVGIATEAGLRTEVMGCL